MECGLSSLHYIVLYPVHIVTLWHIMLKIITLYHMYHTVLDSVTFLFALCYIKLLC